MKKSLLLIFLAAIVPTTAGILAGCTSDKKELELIKQQNLLLQQQIIQQQSKEQTTSIAKQTEQDSVFEKTQSCQKYREDVQKSHYNASVSVYYSPHYDTCVAEILGAKSKSIIDVFSTKGFVIEQDGQTIYDDELGYGKSYEDIKAIVKGK